MNLLLVATGGALGAMLRYLLSVQLITIGTPWSTILINAVGCFLIGMFYIIFQHQLFLQSSGVKLLVIVGVLGGFTTFSTFTMETLLLFENGKWFESILNVTLSLFICLSMSIIGIKTAQAILLRSS